MNLSEYKMQFFKLLHLLQEKSYPNMDVRGNDVIIN